MSDPTPTTVLSLTHTWWDFCTLFFFSTSSYRPGDPGSLICTDFQLENPWCNPDARIRFISCKQWKLTGWLKENAMYGMNTGKLGDISLENRQAQQKLCSQSHSKTYAVKWNWWCNMRPLLHLFVLSTQDPGRHCWTHCQLCTLGTGKSIAPGPGWCPCCYWWSRKDSSHH